MSALDQVELQRQQLEENVARLRKTLQHWRTWDAEYEGLKEEIETSDYVTTEEGCARISEALEGELVNKQEIYDLFGVGKGDIRDAVQVISLVGRRQDYVQQNINTISKQLQSAEQSLEKLSEEQDADMDGNTKAGLPLTEIIEELDEDGNVISTNISQPENATEKILDTLRKVGLTDLDPGSKTSQEILNETGASRVATATSSSNADTEGSQESATESNTAISEGLSDGAKKSVKFADDVHEVVLPAVNEVETKHAAPRAPDTSLLSGSFGSNERVVEIDDDDDIVGTTPIISEDETPEDARLRREMLQYSLNEVGSVVAELDLDEDYSDDDDYDDDFDLEEEASLNSELSEEEDEHGRSLRKGVGSSYRQQMLELEEKLMARMLENVGPDPDEDNPDIDPEDLRKLVVRKDDEMPSAKAAKSALPSTKGKAPAAKKGVRFSDSLDVSEAPNLAANEPVKEAAKAVPAPIIDNVFERRAPAGASELQEEKKPGKVSRFKKDRIAAPLSGSDAETKDEKRPILSNSVVERPATLAAPPTQDVNEFDPEIQQRQLASEYYRMRNNMIRQQGGFKETEEERDEPLMEERDGKVTKVSRFKAARLR